MYRVIHRLNKYNIFSLKIGLLSETGQLIKNSGFAVDVYFQHRRPKSPQKPPKFRENPKQCINSPSKLYKISTTIYSKVSDRTISSMNQNMFLNVRETDIEFISLVLNMRCLAVIMKIHFHMKCFSWKTRPRLYNTSHQWFLFFPLVEVV